MNRTQPDSPSVGEVKRVHPSVLRKMTPAERDVILEAQAMIAEPLYRDDADLTAFDAFGPDDLYVDSVNTETL